MKFPEMIKELEKLGYTYVGHGKHAKLVHPDANRPLMLSYDNKEIGPKMVSRNIKKAKRAIEDGLKLKQARG